MPHYYIISWKDILSNLIILWEWEWTTNIGRNFNDVTGYTLMKWEWAKQI